VLLFLENAAAVLDDARARALADATARGLLAARRNDDEGRVTWVRKGMTEGAAALYVGDAGVGHAFLVRARLRNDAAALATAVAAGDSLLARAWKGGDELHWDRQVEIIYGAAGTALFLLELGAETGERRFVDAALGAARWMIQESKTTPSKADPKKTLRSWRWALAGNRHMPNFSHGTAGVAYALARVAAATGDDACASAARAGAEWLLEHEIRDGDLVRWPVTEGATQSMGGWCHGPPGTARLFLLLHAQTGEQRYLDTALASARWVMAQAGPADAKPETAPEFPPSLCCGVAGVIDFFCDLHRATGRAESAAFAARAADYLIHVGERDGDGIKWRNGASAHGGAPARHGIDLMLGASGEALALLRVMTLGQKDDPVRHLPDRSVGR
jgi:lantibiotic modifying enzyme